MWANCRMLPFIAICHNYAGQNTQNRPLNTVSSFAGDLYFIYPSAVK